MATHALALKALSFRLNIRQLIGKRQIHFLGVFDAHTPALFLIKKSSILTSYMRAKANRFIDH
jgi:hypothetical protein